MELRFNKIVFKYDHIGPAGLGFLYTLTDSIASHKLIISYLR